MTQAMHQILVIEDDASIRSVLRVLLHAEHYRVIEAETAARAEIEARSHKPDLLLVDLGLPDGDGLKVRFLASQTGQRLPDVMLATSVESAIWQFEKWLRSTDPDDEGLYDGDPPSTQRTTPQ